jgi:hypothetical protein
MINPEESARNELTTGRYIGAGRPESLVRGELNPDCPAIHIRSYNTCSIMASALAILPPRSRAVIMGRMVTNKSKLPREIIIEPVQVSNPGIHIARVISDVFVKEGLQFTKVKDLPEREEVESGEVNHVVDTPGKREDAVGIPSSRCSQERVGGMMSCYCILEVVNTSIDTAEIGKNVKLGDGNP